MDSLLRSLYYEVSSPAALGSVRSLYEAARKHMPVTYGEVEKWLRGETTYTLHRQARHNFVRNPVISHAVGEHCQADLVDMQQVARQNSGHKYILTFIDVFSKRAAAVPVKNKSMYNVAQALDQILMKNICFNLLTDRGKEFKNSAVQQVMQNHGIHLSFSYNTAIKASVVERFNRTLRGRMHRYFTAKGTRRYIDVLDQIIDGYNHSFHRSIAMRPVDVGPDNADIVFKNLYGKSEREMIMQGPLERQLFKVGDTVRVRYNLEPMEKSYLPLWSDQTYKVHAVVPNHPRYMYRLENWEGNVLGRKFYSDDLMKLEGDVRYRIEKVLKRQGDQSLVKWTGYPNAANSWVRDIQHSI